MYSGNRPWSAVRVPGALRRCGRVRVSVSGDGERRARNAGPGRFPAGPRLHGDVRVLRQSRRRGVDRDDPPRAGARRHASRHGRHLRPPHQRAARRARDRRPPRPGRARDQVRDRARPERPRRPRHQWAPGVRASAPARTRCSAWASTTSTSTTSTASTPPPRSRRRSGRWPSSSPRARCGSWGCPRRPPTGSAARTRPIPSRRFRPSTRCGRAPAGGGDPADCAASSASALSPTARSGVAC